MFAVVQDVPGSAPIVCIQDADGTQSAVWVGWNRSYVDMDSWLKACGYVRMSFDPTRQTAFADTYELAKY